LEVIHIRYQIINARSLTDLEKMVNNELRHDWQITGGLIAYSLTSADMLAQPQIFFAQAMIIPQPQPKE